MFSIDKQKVEIRTKLATYASLVENYVTSELNLLLTDKPAGSEKMDYLQKIKVQAQEINAECRDMICVHSPKASDFRFFYASIDFTNEMLKLSKKISIVRKNHELIKDPMVWKKDCDQLVENLNRYFNSCIQCYLSAKSNSSQPNGDINEFFNIKTQIEKRLSDMSGRGELGPEHYHKALVTLHKLTKIAKHCRRILEKKVYIDSGDPIIESAV